ncbi:MAG: SDR family oxidoreductase [Chloroflexi bacterium]|nr:SDR family oxidoreductase [Chloroflexota bacterium]MBV9899254.1 SDR family oxidoreductase [Chloroflexota bacterium]
MGARDTPAAAREGPGRHHPAIERQVRGGKGRLTVILVTGCSSGFGEAIALAFAARGDQVVATARDPSRVPSRNNITALRLDVTDQGSINSAVAAAIAQHGRIDVLVNNAGIGTLGALEVVDDQQLRRVFDTNVFGAVAVTRAVLPHMREQGSGRVIFMNAIGGVLTTAFLGAYCASKHALDCIAAVFDLELRPFGIRVSSVYPSAFRTAMSGNNTVILGEGTPYAEATSAYRAGLSERIRNGPSDLSPVVNAVIDAADNPDPLLRYPVAPHLAEVLGPALDALDALHQREMSMTPGVSRRA